MHGPDRRFCGSNEPGGLLLAASDPLAALKFEGAGVEGLGHAWGPEVEGGKVFHTVDSLPQSAFRVKHWSADFTKNPMFIGLKLGSV